MTEQQARAELRAIAARGSSTMSFEAHRLGFCFEGCECDGPEEVENDCRGCDPYPGHFECGAQWSFRARAQEADHDR